MHRSKVLNLLKTFSKDEFKEFGLFIDSPVYNREKVLINLYKCVREYYPDFSHENLDKKKVFKKIFPGRKFSDTLLRNTISDFLGLAEKFLIHLQNRKNRFYGSYLLLKELSDRKDKSLFDMNFRRAEKILNESEIRDEIYYQNKFLLEDERRRNVVINSSKIIYDDDNLKAQAQPLLIQHLIENIKLYAIMLNQKKFIYNHKFDFSFFENVRTYIESNYEIFRAIPYIAVFYNCVMLYKTDDKKYYDGIRGELKKHYDKLSPIDRKNMFIVLTNYNNHQIKKGRFEFYKENFKVFKDLLRTKAYMEGNDFFQHYFYISIVVNAVDAGEISWAENFLIDYKKELHPDFRDSSFFYCRSLILLHKGNYDGAKESLSKVETLDVKFKLFIYHTLLRIYFSNDESDSFYSLTDSFRNFIRRNKMVLATDKIFYNNFIKFCHKLFTVKTGIDSEKTEMIFLKKQIEQTEDVVNKKWLLEKAEEILLRVR